jgi:predicted transcriptional regulator
MEKLKHEPLSLRISGWTNKRLIIIAKKEDVTKSELVRYALSKYIDLWESENEKISKSS